MVINGLQGGVDMPVNIGQVSYAVAEKYHYSATSNIWRNNVSRKITNKATGGSWRNPNIHRMSCAIRVSIALYRAGVRFPRTRYEWTRPSGAIYPSSAGDYPSLLAGGVTVASPGEIKKRVGVIHFAMRGTDHVTLWNGNQCHFGADDSYFEQSNKVTFWQMSS